MIWILVHLYIVPVYMFLIALSGIGVTVGVKSGWQKFVSLVNMFVCMYYFLYMVGHSHWLATLFCLVWSVVCTGRFIWQVGFRLDESLAEEAAKHPEINPDVVALISRVMMVTCVPAIVFVLCEYASGLG